MALHASITDLNLLLAMHSMLPVAQMTCSLFLKVYILYIANHRRTCENFVTVPMVRISASKRIGKVFTIRWVDSSFRGISAVKHSFLALAQHFPNASKNYARQSAEKARFQGLLSILALMADVFNDQKLVRNTTKLK